ncbi:RNA-directed DNA polymerase (Reverse transcriptase), partial [Trifolium medium]|nr:RNA-directed DNA polymerase (Reverse transcriptase) [Trifolium medium]
LCSESERPRFFEDIQDYHTVFLTKKGEATLRLDISKAYDRMDWTFLKDMMIKMGFSQKWIDWIMLCAEMVDYSVIFNGQKVGPIVPGGGLRQGDPLSPYLFILCAEGLSALIKQAENRGDLHGVEICRNAPIISHLLFADDCFLFFKATKTEATVLKNIFSVYESASGQAINLQKSEFYCSRNVPAEVRESIANQLSVTQDRIWKKSIPGVADIFLKPAEK